MAAFTNQRHHPAVAAVYLAAVLLLTMCANDPLAILLSLLGGLLLALALGVRRLWWLLPAGLLAALANALFNHAGETVLLRLFGAPVTAQALAYGAMSGGLLMAILLWCACLNRLLSTERLLCLVGQRAPSLALLVVLTLRFVPRFMRQARRVWAAQRSLGTAADTRLAKWRLGLQTLSGLIGWAFENAADTADSMRARGQGLRPRTSFASRRLRAADKLGLLLIALLAVWSLAGLLGGSFSAAYFPTVSLPPASVLTVSSHAAFAVLCGLPLIAKLRGALWNHSLSVT